MDKNTITGLLLMGAVMLAFMWLNQPDPNAQSPMPDTEPTAQQAAALEADALAGNADTLSLSELNLLAATVRQYGTASGEGDWTVTTPAVEVSTDGTTATGTVNTPAGSVSLDRLTSIDPELTPAQQTEAVNAVRTLINDMSQYKGFARFLRGTASTLRLENDVIAIDLSTKGAMVKRAELKKYKSYRGGNVVIMEGNDDAYSFVLTSTDREFDTADFYFTPTKVNDSTVMMSLDLGGGSSFGLRYTLPKDSYVVKIDVVQSGMDRILPSSVATMDFLWRQKLLRQEEGRVFEERNSALYYQYAGGGIENLKEASNDSEEVNGRIKWIGYKNQFFSSVFIARDNFANAELKSEIISKTEPEYLKDFDAVATMEYSPSAAEPASFDLFIGPNLYPLLKRLQSDIQPGNNLELTRLIPLGWALFRWINTLIIIPVFTFLGHWFTNYGIIILILTIFIKLILFPFTYKSYKSQARMRLLAPDIQAINEKYPGQDNAMVRQQKTMALYSQAGANPMGGCLPMLLQMPVLIAMFTFFPSCIELRGESFLWAKDLSAPDAIVSWTTNIPLISEYFGNHLSLFCILMTVTNIIYTRITMSSQPSSGMPGMKWMMYLMPVMFLVFFNNYAAGLSYYYFLSLLITIVQTYVFRHCVDEQKVRQQMAEAAKNPKKKSGFMARLEEAQRQQQAMLREQQKRNAGGKGKRR